MARPAERAATPKYGRAAFTTSTGAEDDAATDASVCPPHIWPGQQIKMTINGFSFQNRKKSKKEKAAGRLIESTQDEERKGHLGAAAQFTADNRCRGDAARSVPAPYLRAEHGWQEHYLVLIPPPGGVVAEEDVPACRRCQGNRTAIPEMDHARRQGSLGIQSPPFAELERYPNRLINQI